MDKNPSINAQILALWEKLTEDEKKQFIIFFLDRMKKEDQEV
ncbi:hypothetical protein BscR1v2_010720 [Bartonella schoenbuchensis R1]|uniref:Transcriptional regulator n=1 Tax=Bartonella schoenbuchensis (strain DSM 13525 / NCTC 13165 / R1) TaxID=687861 RepID=A0A1S6XR45_BARSR|nr:hypothetical protein BscR1v2_010720 [Bartonella schoenbuchensis R1]